MSRAARSASSFASILFAVVGFGFAAAPSTACATTWKGGTALVEQAKFNTVMADIDNANLRIDAWAASPSGQWIIVDGGKTVHHSAGFDDNIVTGAKLNLLFGREIEGIDCNAAGACILVHSMGAVTSGNVPASLTDKVQTWHNSGWAVRDVEMTNTGWVLLGPSNAVAYLNIDADLGLALSDRLVSGRTIQDVAIGFDGRWVLYANTHPMYEGIDAFAKTFVDAGASAGIDFERVLLGPGTNWTLYDYDPIFRLGSDPSSAVEFKLNDGNDTIWSRMSTHGVPGVSIAIIRNGQVVTARGYGTRSAGMQQPVLGRTPFDLASLSKYVGAVTTLAVLRDTNNANMLTANLVNAQGLTVIQQWLARGQANPQQQGFALLGLGGNMPAITLEQVLSHTASLTQSGSPRFGALEATFNNTKTLDLLSGQTCYNGCGWSSTVTVWNNPNIGGGSAPGQQYAYTSHGYLVAQAVAEGIGGKRASELVHDYVLDPMVLVDSTSRFPYSADIDARFANHHDSNGVLLDRVYYPWTFAGGVAASSRDYAEMMLVTMNDGVASNGAQILTAADALQIRTGRVFGPNSFSYGLGVNFDSSAGATAANNQTFYHSGAHPNRASTYMCGRPSDRGGIVILMNTEGNDATSLRNEILDAFTASMGWVNENCR